MTALAWIAAAPARGAAFDALVREADDMLDARVEADDTLSVLAVGGTRVATIKPDGTAVKYREFRSLPTPRSRR